MKKKILSVVLVIVIVGMSVGVLAYQHLSEVVSLKQTLSQSLQPQTEENIIFDLAVVPKVLSTLESINNSKIAIHFLPVSYKSLLDTLLTYKVEISTVVEQLSSQQQKWIIIFQNSNELRATGGFMGSYSIIDINQGKIVSITTEDIYDADGQFPGFVDPPHGVKEYLSSGNGLRLPDANWNPDTKKSSQQVLHFFALGNKQNVSGVNL